MIDFIDLFSGIGGFRYGLERANYSTYKQIENGDASSRGTSFEEKCKSQLSARGGELGLEKASRTLDVEARCGKGVGDSGGRVESLVERGGGRTQQSSYPYYRCVWSCDNNRYANQIYTKQFGEENHHSGDIRGVDPGDIPDFDLLCAGFPCQSFSVAGKGKGFQDTRGTLFFEISRIAEAKRPKILLLENVKGLLSNDRGKTFQTILQELGRLGYWAEWQVLNSKHYGVPQNRERVFLIGHLRGSGGREIFPIGESSEITHIRNAGEQVASSLQSPGHASGNYRGMTMVLDSYNKGGFKEEEAYALKTNPSPTSSAVIALRQVGTLGEDDQASRIYAPDGLSPTIPTPGGGHHIPKIVMPVLTPDRAEKRQHGRRFKEDGEPSFTLTGQDIHGVAISCVNPSEPQIKFIGGLGGGSDRIGDSKKLSRNYAQGKRVHSENGIAPSLPASSVGSEGGNTGLFAIKRTRTGQDIHGVAMAPIGSDNPTVRSGGRGSLDRHAGDTLTDGFRIRRLTPVECERLQGFPDGWTEYGYVKDAVLDYEPVYGWAEKYDEETDEWEEVWKVIGKNPIDPIDNTVRISDTQRYKCLGNAVTVNVIEFLGELIKSHFKKNARSEDRVDG